MAAAVKAGAAGEQAVAVGDLAHVLVGRAGRGQRAGTAVLPKIDVLFRIEGDDAFAGRARGRLDAHAVFERLAHETIGIGDAQILLGEEWELFQIIRRSDVVGRQALSFHFFAVVGYVVPYVPDLGDEALILPGLDLFAGRCFDFRLIIAFQRRSSFP